MLVAVGILLILVAGRSLKHRISRRQCADVLAGISFLAVLGFSLAILLRPAIHNWSGVWGDDPFTPRTTTTTVVKATGSKNDKPVVVKTTGGGAASKTVKTAKGRVTETTTTTAPADESLTERTLAQSGLLIGRVALAVLAAFLAGAIVQRVVMGAYAVKVWNFEIGDLPAVADKAKAGFAKLEKATNELGERTAALEQTAARKADLNAESARGQATSESLAQVAASVLADMNGLSEELVALKEQVATLEGGRPSP